MQELHDRIRATLKSSGLNARNLATVAGVHYTTIYLILRKGSKARSYQIVQDAINNALTIFEELTNAGQLPMAEPMSLDDKASKLKNMVDAYLNMRDQ